MRWTAAKSIALVVGGFTAGTVAEIWHACGEAGSRMRVQILPCGIGPEHAAIELPRALLSEVDAWTAIAVGPMTVPGLDEQISLRFVAVESPQDKQLSEVNGALVLPILVGDAGRIPDEITVICRHGRLSAASYRYSDDVIDLPAASTPHEQRLHRADRTH